MQVMVQVPETASGHLSERSGTVHSLLLLMPVPISPVAPPKEYFSVWVQLPLSASMTISSFLPIWTVLVFRESVEAEAAGSCVRFSRVMDPEMVRCPAEGEMSQAEKERSTAAEEAPRSMDTEKTSSKMVWA